MITSRFRFAAATALFALLPACSFHSAATHWNKRVGPDGEEVYVRTVTNVGLNVGIILPVLGNTTIDTMVNEITRQIADKDGDHVRVFQTSSENYWYGFPPFTWVLTPVITDVSVEYRPSAGEKADVAKADAEAMGESAEQDK
ncbi:MAG: hypothetical protein NXI31_03185 [bacterium]|nr:hypothetical protein [bacterium]